MNTKDTVVKKKKRMPVWLKAVLLKAWIAGAVYFFVGWGLFLNTLDQLDLTLVLGLVLGIVTDLVTNRIFTTMERGKNEFHQYMQFPRRAYLSFIFNLLYGILLCTLVVYTYHLINVVFIRIYQLPETSVVLGAEPILFGILCMAFDMLFLKIKKLVIKKKDVNEIESK